MVRSQGNTRASQQTSEVVKKRENRNITPSLTLRLRRRLKVARFRPAGGPSNVAPANAVNNSVAGNVFIEINVVLARNGGAVPVPWAPGSGVWQMGTTRRGSRDGRTTGGTRRSSGSIGRGAGRGWGGAATKRTVVRVVARGSAGTVGTLVDGTLIPIMAKTMARVACLMITWVGGRKGNLRVASGPPGFDSLEDAFLIRY